MLKHNRKRNTGLAYEFLVRRAARALVEGDSGALGSAREILSRHFSPGTPMSKERDLFLALEAARGLSSGGIRTVLEEVRGRAREIDQGELEEQRGEFIRDVHLSFGSEFFSERIPEYRFFASAQIVLESSRCRRPAIEAAEVVRVEENLVEHLSVRAPDASSDPLPRIDENSYLLSVKKFYERHRDGFDERQWNLIREHARSRISGDRSALRDVLLEERAQILGRLRAARKMEEFKKDRIMAGRLEQAISRLEEASSRPSDESVRDVLLYHRLCKELDS